MKEDLEEPLLWMVKLQERYAFPFEFTEMGACGLSVSVCVHKHPPYLSSLSSTGKRLFEGAERAAAGDFHVQRVEKTRLWGRVQMVIAVHRLTPRT